MGEKFSGNTSKSTNDITNPTKVYDNIHTNEKICKGVEPDKGSNFYHHKDHNPGLSKEINSKRVYNGRYSDLNSNRFDSSGTFVHSSSNSFSKKYVRKESKSDIKKHTEKNNDLNPVD